MNAPIGRFDLVALDCPDPRLLADFYRSTVGGTIHGGPGGDGGNWVELHTPTGNIAFQRIEGHRPPTWPSGDVPQQAHIDIDVADLDAAEAAALDLGAVKAGEQPNPAQFRVFVDPAGHPFCLVDERFS